VRGGRAGKNGSEIGKLEREVERGGRVVELIMGEDLCARKRKGWTVERIGAGEFGKRYWESEGKW
jgi:hypothetical protein